jgi:hypothetical protein
MRKIFVLLIAALSAVLSSNAVDLPNRKVTPSQARELVLASLSPEQRRLPSLGVDPYKDPNTSKFLFFTVSWEGTSNGSVVVGNYAVDPYTGDVFSATVGCEEEKNRGLEALQKRVRGELHLADAEYQKLKSKGPLCEK